MLQPPIAVTSQAAPERHLKAAEILGAKISGAKLNDAGKILADKVIELMHDLRAPNGLRELGYQPADVPKLVEGVLPQQRIIKLSPRPAGADDFARLFEESMTIW